MIHDEIVKSKGFTLLFAPLQLQNSHVLLKFNVPLLFKGLPSDEAFPKDTHIHIEHVRISPFFEMFLDVGHLPLEYFFIEIGYIEGNEFFEEVTDGMKFRLVLLEVEFKGTEGYATVVESGDDNVALRSNCGFFDAGEWDSHLSIRYILSKDMVIISIYILK